MRLSIYDEFIVGVVRPDGGWSKGRPIAYIEEDDKCVPVFDLLIPSDFNNEEIARYVGDRFCAFAQAGRCIGTLEPTPAHLLERRNPTVGQLAEERNDARTIESMPSRTRSDTSP